MSGSNSQKEFEQQIEAFWSWWNGIAAQFADEIDDGKAGEWAERVAAAVNKIDDSLQWETGPGKQSRHHLAIAGAGDPAQRVLAERILSRGPGDDANWEFYASRQRSAGVVDGRIQFEDGLNVDFSEMKVVSSEPSMWHQLGVEVFNPGFAELDEDRAMMVTFIYLDNLLGEDHVESWVGSVDISTAPSEDGVSGVELRDRIDALAAEADPDTYSIVELKNPDTGMKIVATWRLALRRLDHVLFDTHTELVIALPNPREDGFCDGAELESLGAVEDELLEELGPDAVFFGHATGSGMRTIRLQHATHGRAPGVIDGWITRHPEYDIDRRVSADPGWQRYRDIVGAIAGDD